MGNIKMALGVSTQEPSDEKRLILFHKKNEAGTFVGIKKYYNNLGEYTGELIKLCNNEDMSVAYNIMDIIEYADKPEYEKVINLCYYLLQQEPRKIETIYNHIMGLIQWQ